MPRYCFPSRGGSTIVLCGRCRTYMTNMSELISPKFSGTSGQASLYSRVWNIDVGEPSNKEMTTGNHIVREVFCRNCKFKLGWMYEYAFAVQQRYKETHVILEDKLVAREQCSLDPELGAAETSYQKDAKDDTEIPRPIIREVHYETLQKVTGEETFYNAMPRMFLQHWGGRHVFNCTQCGTFLSNRESLTRRKTPLKVGKSIIYSFEQVANVKLSEDSESKEIARLKYTCKIIACIICETKLGYLVMFVKSNGKTHIHEDEGKYHIERQLIDEIQVDRTFLLENQR